MVRSLFRNSQKLLEKQQSSILSAAGVITLAVFLSSLLGFVRTRLLVSYFYSRYTDLVPGVALDAYWVSFRIPDFVFQILVIGALSAAFIPIYSKYFHKDPEEANDLVNSMINTILLIFLGLSVLIFIFTPQLLGLITGPEFTQEQLSLAVNFTRIMLLAQFFFAISSFMTGFIQAQQRFLIPALSPIVYNLGIILGIVLLGPAIGLYAAAAGVVIGAFLHLLLQLPLAIKLGFRYKPIIRFRHSGVREMGKLMMPRTLATSVDEIESFVVAFLATAIPYNGSYVIVTLAGQLMKAPVRIFGVPIGQASLPFLSKEIAQNSYKEFKQTFISSFHQIMYLVLPAAVLLLVLRIPLVRILFGAKDFPWQSTLLTGRMVAIMSLAIVAHAGIQLINRAFYALHNTKTPLFAATISLLCSSSIAWVLVHYYQLGVVGIAIGITVGPLVQMLVLLIALSQKLEGFDLLELVGPILKMIFAAILMGIFLWIPMRFFDHILDTTRTINLVMLTLAASAMGGLVYLWLSDLLAIKQQQAVIKLLNRLGNWRKVLSSSSETIETKE